jgi:hypothetical protein
MAAGPRPLGLAPPSGGTWLLGLRTRLPAGRAGGSSGIQSNPGLETRLAWIEANRLIRKLGLGPTFDSC